MTKNSFSKKGPRAVDGQNLYFDSKYASTTKVSFQNSTGENSPMLIPHIDFSMKNVKHGYFHVPLTNRLKLNDCV